MCVKFMETELNYMDLLYFGYDWSAESGENKKAQDEFIKEIKERFPSVKLEDVYDSIKGFRQEVYLDESENDNYFSWIIAKQWFQLSFTMQLIMMSVDSEPEQKEKFEKYFVLAKQQYPEEFKSE